MGGGCGFRGNAKSLIGKKMITKNPDGEFTIIGVLHKKMPLFTALPDKMEFELLRRSEPNAKSDRKYYTLPINTAIYIPFATWEDMMKGRDTSVISEEGMELKSKTLDKSLFNSSTLPLEAYIWLKIDTPFKEGREEKIIKDKEDLRVFEDFYRPLPENLKESLDSIRKVLRRKYGEDKYFFFDYVGSLINELNDQIEDSNRLLGIIFISSLLFSCLLLTSMMLISVHKRISEIGVLRALGARKKDIFWQFLAEGVMIYSVGIVIGIFVGILVSYLIITKIAGWEFSIPIFGVIASCIFVFLVGIISSLYPAMRAANIPPAVAVKYE